MPDNTTSSHVMPRRRGPNDSTLFKNGILKTPEHDDKENSPSSTGIGRVKEYNDNSFENQADGGMIVCLIHDSCDTTITCF